MAGTVRLLAANLKPVKLGFQNIVTFCFYPWVILRQNFREIGSPEGLLQLFFEREAMLIKMIKIIMIIIIINDNNNNNNRDNQIFHFVRSR